METTGKLFVASLSVQNVFVCVHVLPLMNAAVQNLQITDVLVDYFILPPFRWFTGSLHPIVNY